MNRYLAAALVLTLSPGAQAQDVSPQTGGWEILNETSPLTGVRTVAGVLNSERPLANMLGYAEHASLVIRCGEGGLAVYVNWPQVVNRDSENFVGDPKTFAIWRIDDGNLQSNLWDISSTGAAAGEFKSKNALRLLSTFANAHRLAVRLTGHQTQDAEFELTGIDEVATNATAACGLELKNG